MRRRFDWAGAALVVAVAGVLVALAPIYHLGHKSWFLAVLGVLTVLFVVLVVAALVGRREPVHADHAAQIERTLKIIHGAVEGDSPHGIVGRERKAFDVHFRRLGGLGKRLKEWERTLGDLERNDESVRNRLTAAVSAAGLTPPAYDGDEISPWLTDRVLRDARSGEPQRLVWGGLGDGQIMPNGLRNPWGHIAPHPANERQEDWQARIDAAAGPVDQLLAEAHDWPETQRVSEAWRAVQTTKEPLLPLLARAHDKKVHRATRRCPICKDNR